MSREDIIQHYHCCATCENFGIRKEDGKTVTYCTRLGFDTMPKYQFDCWDPKLRVVKAIKEKLEEGEK